MGQRLVFDIQKDGERIAKIYYHWSAYTKSCFEEAKILIDGLKERRYTPDCSKEEAISMLLDILENNKNEFSLDDRVTACWIGGADPSCEDELSEISQRYRGRGLDKRTPSRNMGLLCITEDGMENQLSWAEYVEEIDLTAMTFTNNLYTEVYSDEFHELFDDGVDLYSIQEFDWDEAYFGTVPFDECDDAIRWCEDIQYRSTRGVLGTTKQMNNDIIAIEGIA